jgi:hypothetical protein
VLAAAHPQEEDIVPWFPEILLSNGPAPTPSQEAGQPVPYYKGILDVSPDTLLASWSAEPRVDDPRAGLVTGAQPFLDYVLGTREWLALGDAAVRQVSLLRTAARSVEEVVLELFVGGERQVLPVAVVAERDAEHLLTSVRVYHSLWPLFPNHPVHVPVIGAHDGVVLPHEVQLNQDARATADLDALLETYEDDAVVHACSAGDRVHCGKEQVYRGKEELRRLFSAPTVPGARPRVTLCTATDSGDRCAVEYQVTHFSEPRPDQVGITVYERGASGRISSERSYSVSRPSTVVAERVNSPRPLRQPARRSHLALVPRQHAGQGTDRDR